MQLHLSISTRHKPNCSRMSCWSKGKGVWVGMPIMLKNVGSTAGIDTFFSHCDDNLIQPCKKVVTVLIPWL